SATLSHFSLLGGQAGQLEETRAAETDLSFPVKTATASDELHTHQNNCNKPSHFQQPLPGFPSDKDNANRVGNEIIKLTEVQAAAELEEGRAQCRTESQTAGQPELSSFSEGESPSSSPPPSDSAESGNADENQSLEEEDKSSASDAENAGSGKDGNGGRSDTGDGRKFEELALPNPDLSNVPNDSPEAVRESLLGRGSL
ncbi:UNVERIFIED_CONTAM: hypothetical protein K2H54_058849, partial [Gekko kuhli]